MIVNAIGIRAALLVSIIFSMNNDTENHSRLAVIATRPQEINLRTRIHEEEGNEGNKEGNKDNFKTCNHGALL